MGIDRVVLESCQDDWLSDLDVQSDYQESPCLRGARAGTAELLDVHPSTEPVHLNVPGWLGGEPVDARPPVQRCAPDFSNVGPSPSAARLSLCRGDADQAMDTPPSGGPSVDQLVLVSDVP
jgi:hypothetical protein